MAPTRNTGPARGPKGTVGASTFWSHIPSRAIVSDTLKVSKRILVSVALQL